MVVNCFDGHDSSRVVSAILDLQILKNSQGVFLIFYWDLWIFDKKSRGAPGDFSLKFHFQKTKLKASVNFMEYSRWFLEENRKVANPRENPWRKKSKRFFSYCVVVKMVDKYHHTETVKSNEFGFENKKTFKTNKKFYSTTFSKHFLFTCPIQTEFNHKI